MDEARGGDVTSGAAEAGSVVEGDGAATAVRSIPAEGAPAPATPPLAVPFGLVDAVVEALFAQSPFSVALYDERGRVVLANAAYERHWGIRLADVPADYSLLTDPELATAGLRPLIRRAYGLDGSPGEHVVTPPLPYDAARVTAGAGRTVWTQGHCYPVRDAAGRITHVAVVHEDVTAAVEAEAATAALRASEERLSLAQRATAMGVFDWDLVSGTLTWSDEIYRLHGLAPVEPPTYERWLATVHPDDRPTVEAFGRTIFEARRDAALPARDSGDPGAMPPDEIMESEYRVALPNGNVRWVASRVRVFYGAGARPARVLDVNFDLTERKRADVERARLLAAERDARAEAERQRANAEVARRRAEAASKAKSEFLAVMSHELRTPLNAIGGYAELIELGIRGPVTEQQREDLARIQQSQRHLLGLINEVLNYTRIETGAVYYELADVDIGEVIASVEPLVRPQLAVKRIDYSVVSCTPPAAARADREKVRQVLLNLLSNAVKFSDPGGRVRVECAAADGSAGGRVLLRVHDTGIGIPADKLDAVFEPFVQVNAGLTRTQEGTGLGLAISRDLARGMGGDLTAESTVGQGSTFTLVLPLTAALGPRPSALG